MIFIKILLIITLALVFYQDIKERQVYWFLFPVVGLCLGYLFFVETLPELFLTSVIINLLFITTLLCIVFLYARYKLKTSFFKVIGLGDVLFFGVSIFTSASISFIVLFSGALIFSLVLHFVFSKKQAMTTVPLAGYMSAFFGITLLSFWCGLIHAIYQI